MSYVPNRGDVVWIHLDPQAGREQAGHRPALVLSPQSFNRKLDVVFCCPITSRAKRFDFEFCYLITWMLRELFSHII